MHDKEEKSGYQVNQASIDTIPIPGRKETITRIVHKGKDR
jgi:hypothetical protein